MPDFLPRKDTELLAWSANFDTQLSNSYAELGLSADDAAQYHAAHEAFAQGIATISSGATRTPAAIISKDQSRGAVVSLARTLAGQVRANPNVTDEQRSSLGLTLRRNGRRARLPVPSEFPVVQVVSRDGNRVGVRVAGMTETKPPDVKGSMIYTFLGDQPPLNLDEWTLALSTTRSVNDLKFSYSLPPGTQVWIIARWQNPTGGCGPSSRPVYTFIAGGSPGVGKMLQAA